MAKSQTLYFTQSILFNANTIVAGDTTTAKLLYTGNTNDSVIKSLTLTSLDTNARTIQLWANVAGTYYLLHTIALGAAAGSNSSVAAVDGLSATFNSSLPYDANGKRVLPLKAGVSIYANSTASVANTVYISVVAEDY